VRKCCVRCIMYKYTACKAICVKSLPSVRPPHSSEMVCIVIRHVTRLVQQHRLHISSQCVVTPLDACTSKQVATAGLVVPHPEKVTPNSKARIHRDFGYGGEDSFYCAWGPRCACRSCLTSFYQACITHKSCLIWHWVAGLIWRGEQVLGRMWSLCCGIACCCMRGQGVVPLQHVRCEDVLRLGD
jgi:hypothetical protein